MREGAERDRQRLEIQRRFQVKLREKATFGSDRMGGRGNRRRASCGKNSVSQQISRDEETL